ncbi:MFS transporter [Roseococcus microcysteis]|uniref:MFS transporter n=1 Tax=Roseococcus microcysteis TaxID=2771361 RepID=UPI00168AC9EB|nr:MFS transporter [Roseococcus microcysteis]
MSPSARLGVALAGMTVVSQFHRAAVGVVAPELAADLGMGPGALGAANTAFFGALLLAQIPVGVALDRMGPRRLVLALTALAVPAALLQALAQDGGQFLAARFLLGLGCAASFMSVVVLAGRWHRGPAMTGAVARIFAWSQLGILAAGAPLAVVSGVIGWRGAYGASAGLTLMLGLLWWRFAADDPPGTAPRLAPRETLAEVLAGQFQVWATPGLPRILALHMVGYGVMATLLALWAGPYLNDVHGLDPAARGAVLLAMGLAVPAGQLALPLIERRLGRERTVLAMAGVALVALLALAWPGLALWPAAGLLVGVCFFSAYPILLVTQGRGLFPEHRVGRGVTTVNLAQVLGSALLPVLVGVALDGFGLTPAGYRAGFLLLGAALAAGMAGYRFLPRG